MKFRLYSAVCAAGLLAMTACTSDEALLNGNGDGTVTFTLKTPVAPGTRANGEADFGDGTTANRLEYYVYDLDKSVEGAAPIARGEQEIPLQTTVTLNLVNGKSYGIVWFAQNESKPYAYDTEAHTITLDYAKDGAAYLSHNLEDRDAFYAYTTLTVTGANDQTVELYRPFAQVNFGTSDLVSEEEDKVNFDILVNAFGDKELSGLQTKLATVLVPNVLNLMTGEVEGEETLEFLPTARPDADKQAFPYKPETYKHLAMNYILAPKEGAVLDMEFSVLNAGKEYNKLIISSAPVKANYRTNIFGQLLTSTHKFDVVIRPMLKDESNIELGN